MSAKKKAELPRFWRPAACPVCGCRYDCLIHTAAPEPGDEPAAAGDPAKALAEVAAQVHPCPDCGTVPGAGADYGGARRHGRLAILVTLSTAVAVAGALVGGESGRFWTAAAFGAVALASALGHTVIGRLARRRFRTARATRAPDDRVRVVAPGADAPLRPRWVRVGTAVCMVCAFGLIPVCLLPVLLVEAFDWPRLDGSDLEVVSPGDAVRVTLTGPPVPFRVYRVLGTKAAAKLGAADEPTEFKVESLAPATSSPEQKNGNYPLRHPVRIAIPADPKWVGETVRVRVNLVIEKVDENGAGGTSSLWTTVDVPVAAEGAGPLYRSAWQVALWCGALPAAFVGLLWAALAGVSGPKRPPPPAAPAAAPQAP